MVFWRRGSMMSFNISEAHRISMPIICPPLIEFDIHPGVNLNSLFLFPFLARYRISLSWS
jgi:hypothetical protein